MLEINYFSLKNKKQKNISALDFTMSYTFATSIDPCGTDRYAHQTSLCSPTFPSLPAISEAVSQVMASSHDCRSHTLAS